MTKYKNENFEKVTTPITAYCTFKYDHAFLKILEKYDSHSPYEVDHIKYQGEDLKLHRALSPTNIKWENFEFSKK